MYQIVCATGVLGEAGSFEVASKLWSDWCQFFHNKAQSSRGTDKYNHWVNCFNTLKVKEQ